MLYEPIVFLDNDFEGQKAYKNAKNDNLIGLKIFFLQIVQE